MRHGCPLRKKGIKETSVRVLGVEWEGAQSGGVALYSVVRDKELVKWWRQQIRNKTEKSKKEPK